MRRLTTETKSFEINWAGVTTTMGGKQQLVIDLINEYRRIAEVIQDFDGQKSIAVEGWAEGQPTALYEGYTKVVAITDTGMRGIVRIYMEQED
jgi:hypothetical protein